MLEDGKEALVLERERAQAEAKVASSGMAQAERDTREHRRQVRSEACG